MLRLLLIFPPLYTGKVSRMIAAYVGENKVFQELYFNGQIAVELTPMGTIVQKLRAGGAGKFLGGDMKAQQLESTF